ncbi:MAG: MBL fold metallo-hydrolase [Nitrososphaerota archaeon]|nr:MBL fold metallo-hydrolase [Nitrososphaerota archaeon]
MPPFVGDLDVGWICGSRSPRHRTDPPIQVHRYDDRTYILRQSKDVSYEAPFMYLMFGNEKAILLDTGATTDPLRFPLRTTVDRLMEGYAADHPGQAHELIVAHTHGHGDHVAGDGQFADRPGTKVVSKDVDSVRSFYKISSWSEGIGHCDLGGRQLDVLPTPGHHPSAVAIHDSRTGMLLTGDTVYPGRLYAFDPNAFADSMERLVSFAGAREVSHVMGCHIEMTRTPRKDYPVGTRYQPDEPPLQMTMGQLVSVKEAAASIKGRSGRYVFDDFAIYNFPCRRALMASMVRGLGRNFRYQLGLSQAGLRRQRVSGSCYVKNCGPGMDQFGHLCNPHAEEARAGSQTWRRGYLRWSFWRP